MARSTSPFGTLPGPLPPLSQFKTNKQTNVVLQSKQLPTLAPPPGPPRSARGRAAGPSRRHRTLPPLLNFKPRAQEHPGGGGFLGTGGFRTLGAVTPPLPAFPTFPERQLPRPVPEPPRDSGDRCVGGAWAGRGPAAAGGRTRAGPLLSISMNLSTWTFHVTGLIQYVACCVRDFCHLAS